jgi:hypothetical protein
MTPQHFLRYLQQPDSLADLPIGTVRDWVDHYPYSANLRLLLLLRARLDSDPGFETYLADFAASTFDRAHLFQLLEELRLREEESGEVLELMQLEELELADLKEEPFEELPSRLNEAAPEPKLPTYDAEEDVKTSKPPAHGPTAIETTIPPATAIRDWVRTATCLLAALPRTATDSPPEPAPSSRPQPQDPAYFERQIRPDPATELRARLWHLRRRPEPAPPPPSTFDRGEIASETLAELLVRQQQYPRAIRMYRRLALLYPEKKAIFAGLIQELKEKL